ncbi:hypothetical protein [Halopiger djelfimassiliensis]|uniref:hypothetical protein n=1 Tax=Halopiger djelfimassiliensis TaxID=1293047 RepID=UPI0006778515|nr:hypothetical protein [Halopiger djelfimassiliensis]
MTQEIDDGRILVFSYDYEAGSQFEVISHLETSTTVRLLQTVDGETVPEISQPDEYVGHVVRYESANGALEPTTLLFIREGRISSGETASIGEDASMFSSDLNLLATTVE